MASISQVYCEDYIRNKCEALRLGPGKYYKSNKNYTHTHTIHIPQTISTKAFETVSPAVLFLKAKLVMCFFFNHRLVYLLFHFDYVKW